LEDFPDSKANDNAGVRLLRTEGLMRLESKQRNQAARKVKFGIGHVFPQLSNSFD
jgi:hypothetical protein